RAHMCLTYAALALLPCMLLRFLSTNPPPTSISPLSLHDALPISYTLLPDHCPMRPQGSPQELEQRRLRALVLLEQGLQSVEVPVDRKSTRLNSSHEWISYAVFCLKKKKESKNTTSRTTSTRCDWS